MKGNHPSDEVGKSYTQPVGPPLRYCSMWNEMPLLSVPFGNALLELIGVSHFFPHHELSTNDADDPQNRVNSSSPTEANCDGCQCGLSKIELRLWWNPGCAHGMRNEGVATSI